MTPQTLFSPAELLGDSGRACTAQSTLRIPALTVTASGRLIAACDLRPSFHDLPGNISIVLRSSDDGGASWDAPRVLIAAHDGWGFGDPSLVALPNGDVLCLYVASRGLSFWDDERPDGAWQMRLAVSHNDGVTWHHRDITADLLAGHASLHSAFFSSGNGIVTASGRIINPVVWRDRGERRPRVSMALSDDTGASWFLSSPIPGSADETKVTQAPDGTLIATIRGYPHRLVSYSHDDGETWSDPEPMATDPGCNGGFTAWNGGFALTLPQPQLGAVRDDVMIGDASGGRSLSTLQDWSARHHLCLLTGDDPCQLELRDVIDSGAAAYSVAIPLPSGELAVAWEHGNYADIRFATIAPSGRNY